jgi:quercetin dioxygenase-like cupin family protein
MNMKTENQRSFVATLVVSGVLLLGAVAVAFAHGPTPAANDMAKVTPLRTVALPQYPGKEATMFIVDYAPGAVDPVHRHPGDAFLYVLEGSVVMGVAGGKDVTLHAGDTFHEPDGAIHAVGRNASQTEPAKFLVVMLKDQGKPILTPVE